MQARITAWRRDPDLRVAPCRHEHAGQYSQALSLPDLGPRAARPCSTRFNDKEALRMGHARAAKIPARLVEDEDYQLRHERVAGIDIAKGKGRRLHPAPAAARGRAGGSRTTETLPATWREVTALGERLLADGIEAVVMESTSDYWRRLVLPAGGRRAERCPGQPVARPPARRAAEDRPAGLPVAGPPGRDGAAAPLVRAAAAGPGAARPDPHPAAPGPRPHPPVAAAGEAPRGRPDPAVDRGLGHGRQPVRLADPGGHRRRGTRPRRSWPRWRTTRSRAAATGSGPPWRA